MASHFRNAGSGAVSLDMVDHKCKATLCLFDSSPASTVGFALANKEPQGLGHSLYGWTWLGPSLWSLQEYNTAKLVSIPRSRVRNEGTTKLTYSGGIEGIVEQSAISGKCEVTLNGTEMWGCICAPVHKRRVLSHDISVAGSV